MKPELARALILEAFGTPGFIFSDHALERLDEREITIEQIWNAIEFGQVKTYTHDEYKNQMLNFRDKTCKVVVSVTSESDSIFKLVTAMPFVELTTVRRRLHAARKSQHRTNRAQYREMLADDEDLLDDE